MVQRDPFVDPQAFGNEDPVFQYTDPETQDWLVQIIPNLWPILSLERKERFDRDAIIGEGFHEVVITKDPTYSFADFSQQYTELVLKALAMRSNAILRECPSIKEISIFQCYGLQAGGSQPHPHLQIFAHNDVSPEVKHREEMMLLFWKKHNINVIDAVIQDAEEDPSLVVYRNSSYVVVCSHAPSAEYEVQILPTYTEKTAYTNRGLNAEMLDDQRRRDLAEALNVATRALKIALNDPPYNILVRSLTKGMANMIIPTDQHFLGWYIDIRPTYGYQPFGLQPLRGDDTVTVEPEYAANDLRLALKHPDFPNREQMSWQDQYANTIAMLVQ